MIDYSLFTMIIGIIRASENDTPSGCHYLRLMNNKSPQKTGADNQEILIFAV